MAEKIMLVTMQITVSDLPDEERQRHMQEMEIDEELPTVDEHSPAELARLIKQTIAHPNMQETIFEGSDEFVQFTKAKVVSAAWAK